jgi:hypothetical protein
MVYKEKFFNKPGRNGYARKKLEKTINHLLFINLAKRGRR